MKKFKFRFSYFLILGFLGLIFQMVGFFSWSNIDVSQAQLISTSSTEAFELYMKHNYFVIVSAILLIGFAVGIILCSKRDNLLLKIGGYTLGVSELAVIVISIIYLAFVNKNRVDMFKTTEEFTVYKTIGVLVDIKYTATMLSVIGFISTSLGLILNKKEDKLMRIGGYIGTVCNGLFFVSLLTVLISGLFTYSYDLVNGYISFSQKLKEPFELLFSHTNGFTLGQLNRIHMLTQEVNSYYDPTVLTKLHASSIIALISLIANVVALVGNMFFLSFAIVQSFDLSKDENPMEI
jgi:hypothetical protein